MRIDISIKINYHTFQPKTLIRLYGANYKEIRLEKIGSHERDMKKLDENYPNDIQAHWDKYESILIKGKNKFYLMLDSSRIGQIYGGGAGDYSIKKMRSVLDDLIQLIQILNEDGALLFASIISSDLDDQRHKVVTKFEFGGSSTGWDGSSKWDFFEYLPGISWFTYFGKDYIQHIGKEKLLNLNKVTYLDTINDAIAFELEKLIHEISLTDLEEVEQQIGEYYFFNKKRDKQKLSHPKGFIDFLKSLELKFTEKYFK